MTFSAKLYRLLATLLFISGLAVHAQVVGGTLSGVVHDSSGAPLPDAIVTVRQTETGATRSLTTDTEGRFFAPSVPIGLYTVSAAHDGFEIQRQTDIALTVGQSRVLNFTLGLATVQQQVVVVDSGSTVNTTTQQTAGLIDERQVKELPLNGRSYDELLTLNPATVNYTNQRSGGIGTSNSSVGNMFAVSGRRPQDNLFLLNGIEYTGASLINVTPGGTSGQLLGVDAVREFNVVTDTYGATYGKRDGAQVSIVTASGTNQLHGSAYEFIRNSVLDARNYFDQATIPEFQRNKFGGSLGGPIRADKLFLFGNYEGFRQNWGLSDVTLVPDNQARQGYCPTPPALEQFVGVNSGGRAAARALARAKRPRARQRHRRSLQPPAAAHPRRLRHHALRRQPQQQRPALRRLHRRRQHRQHAFAESAQLVNESLREQVSSVQEQHVFSPALLNTARFGYSRASYFFTGYSPVSHSRLGHRRAHRRHRHQRQHRLQRRLADYRRPASTWAATTPRPATSSPGTTMSTGRTDAIRLKRGVWLQRIQSNDMLAQDQYGQASFSTLQSFLQGTVKTFTVVPSPTELGWRIACRRGLPRRHHQADPAPRAPSRFPLRIHQRLE